MAALIGAATLALMSDIAARSGSGSPASFSSSSRERALYSTSLVAILILLPLTLGRVCLAFIRHLRSAGSLHDALSAAARNLGLGPLLADVRSDHRIDVP